MKRKAIASLAVLAAASTGVLVPHLASGQDASSPDMAKQPWSIRAEHILFSKDRRTLSCSGQVQISGPQQQRIQCPEAIITFSEGNKFRTGSMTIEAQDMKAVVSVPQEQVRSEASKTVSYTHGNGATGTYEVPSSGKQR